MSWNDFKLIPAGPFGWKFLVARPGNDLVPVIVGLLIFKHLSLLVWLKGDFQFPSKPFGYVLQHVNGVFGKAPLFDC